MRGQSISLHMGQLLLALLALVISASNLSAQQCPGAAQGGDRFRILFPANSSDGLWRGALQADNTAALKRIADLRQFWSQSDHVRFIFVAERPAECRRASRCNTGRLLWERVRAIGQRLEELAQAAGQPPAFKLLDMAFADEFADPIKIPPAPDGTDAVYLYLMAGKAVPPANCIGQVLIWDPALPAIIGQSQENPALPMPSDRPLSLGPCMRFRVSKGAFEAIIFWGDGSGAYRRAKPALLNGRVMPAPRGRETLYLVFSHGEGDQKAWRSFLSDLTPVYKRPVHAPPLLAKKHDPAHQSKGVGDYGEQISADDLARPKRLRKRGVRLCRFHFTPPGR